MAAGPALLGGVGAGRQAAGHGALRDGVRVGIGFEVRAVAAVAGRVVPSKGTPTASDHAP